VKMVQKVALDIHLYLGLLKVKRDFSCHFAFRMISYVGQEKWSIIRIIQISIRIIPKSSVIQIE
jgi:hypothetical protein